MTDGFPLGELNKAPWERTQTSEWSKIVLPEAQGNMRPPIGVYGYSTDPEDVAFVGWTLIEGPRGAKLTKDDIALIKRPGELYQPTADITMYARWVNKDSIDLMMDNIKLNDNGVAESVRLNFFGDITNATSYVAPNGFSGPNANNLPDALWKSIYGLLIDDIIVDGGITGIQKDTLTPVSVSPSLYGSTQYILTFKIPANAVPGLVTVTINRAGYKQSTQPLVGRINAVNIAAINDPLPGGGVPGTPSKALPENMKVTAEKGSEDGTIKITVGNTAPGSLVVKPATNISYGAASASPLYSTDTFVATVFDPDALFTAAAKANENFTVVTLKGILPATGSFRIKQINPSFTLYDSTKFLPTMADHSFFGGPNYYKEKDYASITDAEDYPGSGLFSVLIWKKAGIVQEATIEITPIETASTAPTGSDNAAGNSRPALPIGAPVKYVINWTDLKM